MFKIKKLTSNKCHNGINFSRESGSRGTKSGSLFVSSVHKLPFCVSGIQGSVLFKGVDTNFRENVRYRLLSKWLEKSRIAGIFG